STSGGGAGAAELAIEPGGGGVGGAARVVEEIGGGGAADGGARLRVGEAVVDRGDDVVRAGDDGARAARPAGQIELGAGGGDHPGDQVRHVEEDHRPVEQRVLGGDRRGVGQQEVAHRQDRDEVDVVEHDHVAPRIGAQARGPVDAPVRHRAVRLDQHQVAIGLV